MRSPATTCSCALVACLLGQARASDAITPSTPTQSAVDSAEAALTTDRPSWQFKLQPYLWIPAQIGTVAIQGMAADLDLGVGDTFDAITDNFNFAAAVHAEVSRDRLTFFADAMYLSLEANDVPTQSGQADVRQDQGIFEIGGAYTLIEPNHASEHAALTLQPLAGVRVHTLSLDIDDSGGASFSGTQTWADGFVGLRADLAIHERVALRARGDLGAGGSDFTWNALAGVEVKLGDSVALEAGYRALDTDFSDGHGDDRFEYDVLLHGPYVALNFTF